MDLEPLWDSGIFDRFADPDDNLGKVSKTSKWEGSSTSDRNDNIGPWVVEWCCMGDQKDKVHICTLDEHIRTNHEALLGWIDGKYVAPWLILGVFRTPVDAGKYASLFYPDE